MLIKYWVEYKGEEYECHHMQLENTGIEICGVSKQAAFEGLMEKLDFFIQEFEQLKSVEIGNVQEQDPPECVFNTDLLWR